MVELHQEVLEARSFLEETVHVNRTLGYTTCANFTVEKTEDLEREDGVPAVDVSEHFVAVDFRFGEGSVHGGVLKDETVSSLQVEVRCHTAVHHDKVSMSATDAECRAANDRHGEWHSNILEKLQQALRGNKLPPTLAEPKKRANGILRARGGVASPGAGVAANGLDPKKHKSFIGEHRDRPLRRSRRRVRHVQVASTEDEGVFRRGW